MRKNVKASRGRKEREHATCKLRKKTTAWRLAAPENHCVEVSRAARAKPDAEGQDMREKNPVRERRRWSGRQLWWPARVWNRGVLYIYMKYFSFPKTHASNSHKLNRAEQAHDSTTPHLWKYLRVLTPTSTRKVLSFSGR